MTRSNDPEHVAIDVTSKMGIVDEATCVRLLESTPIGRIGFSADGEVLVLPVNFKVDQWDAATRTGWSVVVQGVAREVTNWAEDAHLDQIGLVPWAKAEWRPIWVRIEPTMISGRILR